MTDHKVTMSSGNIFADLGFENPEEEMLKAKLSRRLREILREKGWSEVDAATVLGLEPYDISEIVVGQTEGISIDRLVRCLDRLDYKVDLVVRRKTAVAAA